MESLLAFYQCLVALALGAMIIVQAKRGTVPIFAARNFFYFGVLIFQLISAALAFTIQDYWQMGVGDPAGTGVKFSLILTTFIILFELVYRSGWFSFGLVRKLQTNFSIPSDRVMMAAAVTLVLLAVLFRFVFVYVPVFSALAGIIGTSLATAASGLICWIWARNLTNPLYVMVGAGVIGTAIVVTTFQAFGRRDLLSVMSCCLWGAYHGYFKYVPLRRSFIPLTVVAGCGMIMVAAFTAARSHENTKLSQAEMNSRILNADIKTGVIDLLSGQYAAPISMWLIESRPSPFAYSTLHSLKYAATNIIPRVYYDSKPVALGLTMVPEAGLDEGRGEGFTVGPGLVGHIWNDNPYLALPLYAILLGVILHVMDKIIALQPSHPLVVLPVGGALGDLIAIARGETGYYIFRTVAGVIVVYIALRVFTKLLMGSAATQGPPPSVEPDEESLNAGDGYGETA